MAIFRPVLGKRVAIFLPTLTILAIFPPAPQNRALPPSPLSTQYYRWIRCPANRISTANPTPTTITSIVPSAAASDGLLDVQ